MQHSNRYHFLWCFVCLFLVSGCQSSAPDQLDHRSTSYIQHADQLTEFSVTGRIAVETANRRQSIRFVYQQLERDFELKLVTLLGVSVGAVRWQNNQLETRFDGKTLTGDDARQQAYRFLPLNFDLGQFGNYLTANIKDSGLVVRDSAANIEQLRPGCSGCHNILVSYSDYISFQGIDLPTSIIISDLAKQYRARIQIHQWER